MLSLLRSPISLVLVSGCGLYFGNAPPNAADAPSVDSAPDSTPDSTPNGPDDSPVLSPPPGAPCTAPLPTTSDAYVAPQSCGLDGYSVPTLVNTHHMRAALVAQWLKCAGSPFATSDEIGLEFTDDGHWYKLYLDGAGGIARGHGFQQEGTYDLLYVYDHVQLNMNISGSGIIYAVPAFTTAPVKLRVNNMGIVGDYIRDDDTGACLPPS
jgi:hypothetical protein